MKRSNILLVCHPETDPQTAIELLEDYIYEIAMAVEFQIFEGGDPHVIITHASENCSILYYAGNQEFAMFQGYDVASDIDYCVIAMPRDCTAAVEIEEGFYGPVIDFSLD